MSESIKKCHRDINLAFDVGHSSIGWAVLKAAQGSEPHLLGCGSVIFPADDCLASKRRQFRRQRRHIRATRLRIARLQRLLAHLGVLTPGRLDAVASSSPWYLAARVLRGGEKLSWPELWDVLRWYAHNRGYDGNRGWSRQEIAAENDEDTQKLRQAHELLDDFEKRFGRTGSMAEVFCDVMKIDPLGAKTASRERVRNLNAAFPRDVVEDEVERILRAHIGILPSVDESIITALMRDHKAIAGPAYHLPKRYGQRLRDGTRSPGGLLFGQLVPRFDNRIIASCPMTFQEVYDKALAEDLQTLAEQRRFEAELEKLGKAKPELDEEELRELAAKHVAEVASKVPSASTPEFYHYRWLMQVANILVAKGDRKETRRLTSEERKAIHAEMVKHGALTKRQLKDTVRALTGTKKDNLEQMLAMPEAERALVLDPGMKLLTSGLPGKLWPHLDEATRQRTLSDLRRGIPFTIRHLLDASQAAQPIFDHWWDGEAMKKPGRPKKAKETPPKTRDGVLDEKHSFKRDSGRAPFSRDRMRRVSDFVLSTDRHPAEGVEGAPDNGPLYRSEAIREAQLRRALDEQTNNHLVRHRLRILERLHEDILKEYAGADRNRIARITIEVNRDLREMSGKTVQEQAKEQGQLTAQFRGMEKKLNAAYEGAGVHLAPGFIRKGRIAEDLGWKCPFTGKAYDALDLLHRRVDKDHIIPRSQRPSDSLDSLVITLSEINRWKGNRTAVQFVEQEQGNPVPGLPNVHVKTLTNFLKDVDGLETFKGHSDDQRRKRNRKRLLRLRDYVEKEFTPGDLTRTSQLVRLGAQALQRHYLDVSHRPVITSLPGSVTGAVRKSWDVTGCLALANPLVLNPEEFDRDGKPKVHRKTEIRGITHLHHALDACVLAFADLFLGRDGGGWELLVKRRLNPAEQQKARLIFQNRITIDAGGQLHLVDLPAGIKNAIAEKLAERRVVQHIPSDLSGLESKETVWRLFDPADQHPNAQRLAKWLKKAEVRVPDATANTAIIICRKRRGDADDGSGAGGRVFYRTKTWDWIYDIKDRSALLGSEPKGDPADSKLRQIKAVKVLGDNFGIALEPEPTLIRPHKIWHQLQALRKANGGVATRLLRMGSIVRIRKETSRYRGLWMVRGLNFKQRDGFVIGISPADYVVARRVPGVKESVSLKTLIGDGMDLIDSSLCGVANTLQSSDI